MVVVRKNISKEQGDVRLIDDIRYLFYISNDLPSVSSQDIVFGCNDRCDQENLIAQLSGRVRSLCAPVDNLQSNCQILRHARKTIHRLFVIDCIGAVYRV
jgi:hypothetical protein